MESPHLPPQELSLSDLTDACRHELMAFQRHESTTGAYGYELMRRAICLRDNDAWQHLAIIYRGLVLGWIRRRAAVRSLPTMSTDDWVFSVFGRFAVSLRADRFATFPTLAALLRYLQACTLSTVIEELRATQSSRYIVLPAADWEHLEGVLSDPTAEALDRHYANDIWQIVVASIKDEAEYTFAVRRLQEGYTPREIAALHPVLFSSVAEVYRVGRNLIERLRRHPHLCLIEAA